MICAICKKPLSFREKEAHVWTTAKPVINNDVQEARKVGKSALIKDMWLRAAVHVKCLETVDYLIINNKIRSAAGHACHLYAKRLEDTL